MKGYRSILLIILSIITLSYGILTGMKLNNEINHEDIFVDAEAVCARNNLCIGSLEDEFYILFKADYEYTVGTTVYSFSQYDFLRKQTKLGDVKKIRYNVNNPDERYEDVDNLAIKLIISLIVIFMVGFFLVRTLTKS